MFNSGKDKMLMCRDFDLNSVHVYTDSLKEGIKQTMLKQEIIFRKQVHELHRIYGVQKSLMKDLGYKDCDRYNSWNAKAQLSLPPLTNPTRYEPLDKETKFSSIARVDSTSTTFISQGSLAGYHGAYFRLQQRPLDLQLSADEFIDCNEKDIPKKENVWNSLKEPIDVNHRFCGGNSSGPEELKLSLSTGEDHRKMGSIMRTSFDKKTFLSVIDLEEPCDSTLNGYAKCTPYFGCAAPEPCFKVKLNSQGSVVSHLIISSSHEEDPSQEIVENRSFQEYSDCCQERASSNKGLTECCIDITCNHHSCKMQQFTSCQGGHLDLNKVHLDDSSCYSNDHILAYPLTASSIGGFGGVIDRTHEGICLTTLCEKEVSNCSNETSDMLSQGNVVDPGHTDFNSKTTSKDIWARNSEYNLLTCSSVNLIGPESMSRAPVVISEDLGSCSGDHKNDNVVLNLKPANGVLHDSNQTSTATREVSCEKSEVEDTVFSCTDQTQNTSQDGDKSPASCKSCICDNDSSSAKTMHSGITSGVLSQNSKTQIGSQVPEVLSGEHDLRTSDNSDLENKCYNKKEESAEVDVSIQIAAESLINISLRNSACYQDSSSKARSKEMENRKREQPQYSSDSFELIAMKLTESNVDDNSVSSKSYELDDAGTKDFGFKLRRGRRLKDFQKEILPGLASLSRHEIQEDINIMEGVLRSREYRRMRAKMETHGENQSAPVRSRRSRLNYARRNISRKFN